MKFLIGQRADGVEETLVWVGRVKMPARFEAHLIEHENGDPDVSFVFEVRNGAPECREVHIKAPEDGHEIRCSGLAGIRVQDVLEEAIKRLIRGAPTISEGRVNWPKLYPSDDEKRDAIRAAQSARKVKVTDELLREVAAVYRANVEGQTTAALVEHFGKQPRTVTLYAKTARERIDPETGKPFLGAAINGKAGEQ